MQAAPEPKPSMSYKDLEIPLIEEHYNYGGIHMLMNEHKVPRRETGNGIGVCYGAGTVPYESAIPCILFMFRLA